MFHDCGGGTTVSARPAIKVLHLIGTSDIGGTERFLIRLADSLDRDCIRTRIAVVDAAGALAPEYARVAETVCHLEWRAAHAGRAIRRWRHEIEAWRPDVVVLYGSRANLIGRLWSGRVPVITSLRSLHVDNAGSRTAAWLDKRTFSRVFACVSNSHLALRRLAANGYARDRLVYIPNAIDVGRFAAVDRSVARIQLGVDDRIPVVVCVARLAPVKAHDLLLRASAQLANSGIVHALWLIGDGNERARLERLADDLGVKDSVHFLGALPDVALRLRAADVGVLASRWEGMPTAILEAMAAGLPVVATQVGEVPAIVADGRFGRLVPPDDIDALASALRELVTDQEKRAQWGARAATAAGRFTMASVARAYENLFEWAVGRIPQPRPELRTTWLEPETDACAG